MRSAASLTALLVSLRLVSAHGDHGHGKDESGKEIKGDYALRHMATEHHIDTFDPMSFFHLHDFNRDGQLDRDEIEAIYGVHHPYSQKQSSDEAAHSAKANHIVQSVLNIMDADKDGKISIEEFQKAGVRALPNFDDLGAEGHHYDVESEFFLHHEEQFHSTPDTQTDESYTHPEDLEHFAQHAKIEADEIAREAEYQGISVEDAQREHDDAEAHAAEFVAMQNQLELEPQPGSGEGAPEGGASNGESEEEKGPAADKDAKQKYTYTRTPKEKQDPSVEFKGMHGDSEWGVGDAGYKVPKTPGERMRKNVPYKYKFRRNWGDF